MESLRSAPSESAIENRATSGAEATRPAEVWKDVGRSIGRIGPTSPDGQMLRPHAGAYSLTWFRSMAVRSSPDSPKAPRSSSGLGAVCRS